LLEHAGRARAGSAIKRVLVSMSHAALSQAGPGPPPDMSTSDGNRRECARWQRVG
jgi:hypothetical protein